MNRTFPILGILLAASTAGAIALYRPEAPDTGPIPVTSLVRLLPASAEGAACSLTRAQEQEAVDAFDELLPVVLHPRCFNCHGGVEPFKSGGGHMGGDFRFTAGDNVTQCQDCHSELPGWDVPPSGFFFTEKDGRDLCMLFKSTQATGADFVRHIENDKGKTMFTVSAFKGDRALNTAGEVKYEEVYGMPPAAERPPGTHAEFTEKARAWVKAMGSAWHAPGDCGCKVRGDAWVGSVTMVNSWNLPEMGIASDSVWARIRLVVDSSYDTTDDSTTYWKSVSGTLKWKQRMEGRCTMSGSGSFPIRLGADLNPLVVFTEKPKAFSDTVIFHAGLGPWPDAAQPRVFFRCKDDNGVPPRPWVSPMLSLWWRHPLSGMKSSDGTTLTGRYSRTENGMTTTWTWNLRMEP